MKDIKDVWMHRTPLEAFLTPWVKLQCPQHLLPPCFSWLFSPLTTQHLMNCHLHTRITYELPAVSLEPLTLGIQWTFLVEYVNKQRRCLHGERAGWWSPWGCAGGGWPRVQDSMARGGWKWRLRVTHVLDTVQLKSRNPHRWSQRTRCL